MMINLALAAGILIAASGSPLERGFRPADYSYANMYSGKIVGFFEDRAQVQFGDLIFDAKDCSTSTAACIEANGLFIAIPGRSSGFSSDGTRVVAVKEMDVRFLGIHTHVRIIEARRRSVLYRSWYSDEVGLLAFTIVAEGKVATYFLQQEIGLKAGRRQKLNRPDAAR